MTVQADWPKVAVEYLTFLIPIREVSGSYLDPEIGVHLSVVLVLHLKFMLAAGLPVPLFRVSQDTKQI